MVIETTGGSADCERCGVSLFKCECMPMERVRLLDAVTGEVLAEGICPSHQERIARAAVAAGGYVHEQSSLSFTYDRAAAEEWERAVERLGPAPDWFPYDAELAGCTMRWIPAAKGWDLEVVDVAGDVTVHRFSEPRFLPPVALPRDP